MKTFQQRSRFNVLIALLVILNWGWFTGQSAMALDDRLGMPAMKTDKAHKSLLTDAAQAGERLVAVGEQGQIIFSEDDGHTWTQAQVPVRVNLTAIHFSTPQKGWVSGHDGVMLHTEDGGKTWQKQLDGATASEIVLAAAKRDVERFAAKAAESRDSEDIAYQLEMANWRLEEAQRDIEIGPSKPIMDIWFKNDQEGFAVGGFGYFFHTRDGGKTWEDYATKVDNPDSLHLYAVTGVKNGAIFVVGEEGNIFRSNDGGDTWQHLESPYTGGLFGVFGTDVDGQVFVFGLKGNTFRSNDLGNTWQRVAHNVSASLYGGLSLPDKRLVFVGQNGTLLVCSSNAESCRVIPRRDRSILSSVVPTGNGKILVVGMRGLERLGINP
ncbi:MAG: photosystem I reaction center subunit IV [Deltaproteobacteria bacterium]|nr:photosystem I reaction center subunit IV [Deltaproteobacteria bacterium]